METFAVFRRRGEAYDPARPLEGQQAWQSHADYMMALARDGFVLLAGPMAERDGALIVVWADSAAQVEAVLAGDPWTRSGLLRTEWIAPWEVRIGTLGP